METDIINTLKDVQKELDLKTLEVAELKAAYSAALDGYKREHIAHSVTLQQLEASRTHTTMWERMFNSERKASDALYRIIKSR